MALQYNDQRNINSHTHIDQPLTCGIDNLRTVTWVDFIDFRQVDNFGFGSNKQPIGGTWLNVLEKLQVCFDNINASLNNLDNRLTQLEAGTSAISILGGSEIQGTSLTLQSSVNVDWFLDSVTSSDTSFGATEPNITISNNTNNSIKVNVGGTPTWDIHKGTIKLNSYTDGGTVTIDDNGLSISAAFTPPSISQVRWEAAIKAVAKTNDQVNVTHTVYKIFNNPYNSQGAWTWSVGENSSRFTLDRNGNTVTIRPNGTTSCTGRLDCTNANASNALILYVKYTGGLTYKYTVSFNTNGGSSVPSQTDINSGNIITLPSGPTWSADNTYTYSFGGWYLNSSYTGTKYNTGDTYTVSNNVTFFAKKNSNYKEYTATFNSNGGNSVSAITGHYNDSITLPTASQVTKPASGNTTYELSKWIANGNSYNPGATYNLQNNVTFTAQWTENTTELFTYYFGTATEDQIQSQSYINSLDYNRMDVKPVDLNFEEGYNVLVIPASWGTPTVKDPNGFPYTAFGLDELGITNPTGKIALVYSSGQIEVTLEWN